MNAPASREPLAPEAAERLADFARACKAAARAVSLYPGGHPAIGVTLERLVAAAGRATADGPLTVTVVPDGLLVGGRAPTRPDAAVTELAVLLHGHLVGEITVDRAADGDSWRAFLQLLARAPDEVQAAGGLARLWSTAAGLHLQVRELDYATVLAAQGDREATWDEIVTHCLAGESRALDDRALQALLELAGDPDRLADLAQLVTERASGGGSRAQARALLQLLRAIAEGTSRCDPQRLDQVMSHAARVTAQLSPDVMLDLLAERYRAAAGDGLDVVGAIVDRMSDTTVASFVASSVSAEHGATVRLAQAFQAIVPEVGRRADVVELAGRTLKASPLGQEGTFEDLWRGASEMLLSYRDETYVPADYGRELSRARERALDVEQTADDPPERVTAWLATVTDPEIRALDMRLLLDLLQVEEDADRWREMLDPVAAHLDDLALVGDFETMRPLVETLTRESGTDGRADRRSAVEALLGRFVAGPLIGHLPGHLRTGDEALVEGVQRVATALGPIVIRPLAEALAAEERGRAARRLTDLLLGFGRLGAAAVDELKHSPNPAVRRTAIQLLRQFGGSAALPELAPLLDDREPHVQREALEAIVNIGTDEAYQLLERALASGTARARDAILGALASLRDERAVPLFCYMVRNRDYRRQLPGACLAAIEGLGALGGPDAIEALGETLVRGEWWAPFRTAAYRKAAAAALARVGTPEARAALDAVAATGPRGARSAARPHLERLGPPGRRQAAS